MRFLWFAAVLCVPLSVSAAERYVCTPGPDGRGWVCAGNAAVPDRAPTVRNDASATSSAASRPSHPLPAPADAPVPAPQGAAAIGSTTVPPDTVTFDWVAYEALPASIAAEVPAYCGGAYVEPSYPFPRDVDASSLPVEASAASVDYWLGDRAELSGGVRVAHGNRSLTTEHAVYVESSRSISVGGDIVMREPGLLVRGDRAEVALDSGAARIESGRFVLHESALRGKAALVARSESGDLAVEEARFTRCEPGNDSWLIRSESIDIPAGARFGTARNAVLRVHDVPVFYAPYIRFPVTDERLSGFLFPDVGYDADDGVDLALPYYFNLAPNYDATLTPRWIAERGVGAALEFRHMSRSTQTEIGGGYLYDDDQYDGELSRDDFESLDLPGDFEPEDRWLVSADHSGRFGAVSTFVDFADVSDDDYFRDLGTDLSVASRIDLEQRGEVRLAQGGFSARLWAQDFEVLDDETVETYRRLPELALSYRGAEFGPFVGSLSAAVAEFYRANDDFTGIDRLNGRRIHVEPRVELPFNWPFGFLRLGGGFRYTQYDLDDEDADPAFDSEPEREVALGSADAGLVFEREGGFFGSDAIQTLEPRLFYLYQGNEDQDDLPLFDSTELTFGYAQLFRDNRYAGLDRIGDANQLSTGVTTRYQDARNGRERLRASLGQIFYFDDREVTLDGDGPAESRQSSSAFAGETAAALTSRWSLLSNAVYDPHEADWTEVGAHLQFSDDSRRLFNVGFRRLDDYGMRLRQVDTSFYWPVLRHFAFFGRWYYDFETDRDVELFGGIEYNDCCWQVRVVGRRFLSAPGSALVDDTEEDAGVYLQIVFKGLAGIGGRIDGLMENGIRGFVPEEN